MGNNQSRGESSSQSSSTAQTGSRLPGPSHVRESSNGVPISSSDISAEQKPQTTRRQSIQALRTGRGEPVAPAASLASAEYKHSSNNSLSNRATSAGRVIASAGSTRPTTASSNKSAAGQWTAANAHTIPGETVATSSESLKDNSKMGGQQSRPSSSTPPIQASKPEEISKQRSDASVAPLETSAGAVEESDPETPLSPEQLYALPPPSGISRPPRLPLPIQEEEFQPGSPIIPPADLSDDILPISVDPDGVGRTRSMLSGTTADDDDGEEESQTPGGLLGEAVGPAIPTIIEWRGPGEKVYVTGTFAGWDRKYRLQENGPSQHRGALSAVINLHPGTHHLNFIVDGEMRLSTDLPTAVDFTNFLVNYIEVLPGEQSATTRVMAAGDPNNAEHPTSPIDIKSGASVPAGPSLVDGVQKKLPQAVSADTRSPQVTSPVPDTQTPSTDSRQLPPQKVQASGARSEHESRAVPVPTLATPKEPQVQQGPRIPTKYYHNIVPQYLYDLDHDVEGTSTQRNALALADTLPAPPSLPMFLSKSVLNGTTPVKDDASVLTMPNHTVLNHLATSSIRQGVLATSATTRYRQKFLTSIIYKPTKDIYKPARDVHA